MSNFSAIPEIYKQKNKFLLLTIVSLLNVTVFVGTAFCVKYIFDQLISTPSQINLANQSIVVVSSILLGLILTSGVLVICQQLLAEKIGQQIILKLRSRIVKRLIEDKYGLSKINNIGGLGLRLTNDLTAIQQWIIKGIPSILIAGTMLVVVIGVMAVIDYRFAIIIFSIAASAFLLLLVRSPLEHSIRNIRQARGELANRITDNLQSLSTIKIFSLEKKVRRRVNKLSERILDNSVAKAKWVGIMRGATIVIIGLMTALTLLLGIYLSSTGDITFGTLAAIITVAGLMAPALKELSMSYEYWIAYVIAVEKINKNLKRVERKTKNKGKNIRISEGDIKIRNASIKNKFSDFNAVAEPSQKVVLIGESGSGKSLIGNLLVGLTALDSGELYIDNNLIDESNVSELKNYVSIVGPHYPLFKGTIRQNLNIKNVSKNSKLNEIINKYSMSKLSESLGTDLDMRLMDNGSQLNFESKSCIMLIRALLSNPKILFIDLEGYSNYKNLKVIVLNIFSKFEGTCILISRDNEIIRSADQVWDLSGNSCSRTFEESPNVNVVFMDKK